MGKRSQFDEIYDSMVNGQRRQALDQLKNNVGLAYANEVLDYIALELEQPEVALDLAKSYFRITYG